MVEIIKQKAGPTFYDPRGSIVNVWESEFPGVPVRHVALIKSSRGSVRGNHYHNKSSHWTYLLWGSVIYCQGNPPDAIVSYDMIPGDVIFTPNGVPHSFTFLEDSAFLALATDTKSNGRYEADTVRLVLGN